MSKATPMRTGDNKGGGGGGGGGGSYEYCKRLRSYKTPPTVRRSPRFLPQINKSAALEITAKNHPPNSTKKPSSNRTHLRSPPISPALVPISKTHRGFSTKCPREPLRSVGNLQGEPLRRSTRLSSMHCAKTEENKENDYLGLKEAKEKKIVEEKKRKREGICKKKIGSEGVDAGECGGSGGWTKEQDGALHRAYLAAKPSPHFWKKVAKMVPGKSAQECFDRVNGSLETPPQPQPQPQPRSRAKRSDLSPITNFSLSGSKPLQHPMPLVKKLSSGTEKNLIAQKTARHLLKKHCVNDQNHEADHFSALETSLNAHSVDFLEARSLISPSFLTKCSGGSSSAHRRMLSRFKPFAQERDPSPAVLKRVKNVALHEKYIDQLRNRDARRGNVTARVGKNEGKSKTEGLTDAKTALMSKAREFICHFQQMRANCQGDGDTEDAVEEDEEEDEEDE